MSRGTPDPRRARPSGGERPAHPTRQAILLLVAVTILIIALAALSSWGTL